MSDEPGKPPLRQIGRPFPKGKSGNPGGRPKELAELRELLREAGALPMVVGRLLDEIHNNGEHAIKACELVAAYLCGKPTQALELTGGDGEAIAVEVRQNDDPGRIKAILGVLATVGVLPPGADALTAGGAADAEDEPLHPSPAPPDPSRVPPA